MRLPRTFFLFCLQGIVPTRPSWLSRTETDSGCPRGHAVPSGTWTGVTGVVPRAGLSREPLSLKHTLLGLKYGAKVDKVLRVRPSQNGGSRPPTLRTTQTPSFLNEALRPDARLRHAAPETEVSCSFVDGFHASPWAWGPRALLWGPVWGPGQRRLSSRSRIVEPGVALAGRLCWIAMLRFHLSPAPNHSLLEDLDIVPAFLGPRIMPGT